jgi:nucleoid DNA-binding protein
MSQEMIDYISGATTYSPTVVNTVLDAFYKYVQLTLPQGEEIKIKGFGNFGTSEQKERMGRNPRTGEDVWIESKVRPYFKFSKNFKESIQPSQLPPLEIAADPMTQNVASSPNVIAPPLPPIPPLPQIGQPERQWYFANNGNANLLREADLLRAGVVKDSLVWNPSMPNWSKASDVEELKYLFS